MNDIKSRSPVSGPRSPTAGNGFLNAMMNQQKLFQKICRDIEDELISVDIFYEYILVSTQAEIAKIYDDDCYDTDVRIHEDLTATVEQFIKEGFSVEDLPADPYYPFPRELSGYNSWTLKRQEVIKVHWIVIRRSLESYLEMLKNGISAIQDLEITNSTIIEACGMIELIYKRAKSIYTAFIEEFENPNIETVRDIAEDLKAYSVDYVNSEFIKRFEELPFKFGFDNINEKVDYSIQQINNSWEIVFAGKKAPPLGNLKGMILIRFLIENRGKEYFAVELLKETGQRPDLDLSSPEFIYAGKDIKEIKEAIKSLKTLRDEETDVEKRESLDNHINETEKYLRESTTKAGKPRKMSDTHRVSIVNQYETVLKHIEKTHPELHSHLKAFLKIGTISHYKPDSSAIKWQIL